MKKNLALILLLPHIMLPLPPFVRPLLHRSLTLTRGCISFKDAACLACMNEEEILTNQGKKNQIVCRHCGLVAEYYGHMLRSELPEFKRYNEEMCSRTSQMLLTLFIKKNQK